MIHRKQIEEIIEKIKTEKEKATQKSRELLASNTIPTQDIRGGIIQQTNIIETCDGHINMLESLLDKEQVGGVP